MAAKPGTAALSSNYSWIKRGLLTALFVLVLVSLVYSAPVPDNEEGVNGNNDLASGEASGVKTNIDDGFDELINAQATDDDDAKPKEPEETEVVYRTQTQGVTLPHFVFTTGPTTLPPIPKITTHHPIPMQTTPRPDEEELHIDIQGVMTRPPSGGVFTTAHVPEPIETTQTTVSTTTTAEDAGGVLVDVVDIDTKDEDKAEPTTTTTTTTAPETTAADSGAILVGGGKEEDLEPIDKLIEMDNTTTTTVPTTTTTVAETTAEDGGAILVGGEKEEDLEPIDKLLEMDTTPSPPTTTTTEEVTEAAVAGGAVLVGSEKAEDETTTTTTSTTQSTTPVMVVIVDGGEDEEPSSSTTTTTTTTTTTEPTTEAAEKPVYPGVIDTDKKTDDDVVYTTPTTTVLSYTTKQPTEEPSSTTIEVIPIAKVGLNEPEKKENRTNDEELQKIVVEIDAEPTVVVDPEDDAVNGTLIGESKSGDGLSNGARTGIAIACIVAFWLILGPIVCCICKMRDKKRDKKEQEERNAREKASNHLVEEMVKAELQKQPNGDHKQNGDYKKAQYKDEKPYDEAEFEPITIGHSDSVPYIDADADSRDTEL